MFSTLFQSMLNACRQQYAERDELDRLLQTEALQAKILKVEVYQNDI
jgi:hypothetical protein